MKKIFATLLAATIAFPTAVHARTPQQVLYAHLVEQARKSGECSRFPAIRQFCHPSRVSGTAKDATQALRYMRNVEMLGILCSGGDVNACQRQGAMSEAAKKLGWCAQASRGLNLDTVILWARCAPGVIYTPGS
jgi:hypothetical protein